MKNKGRGKSERYVWLRFWLLDSPAWKSLPVGARALYVEIARRYNGSNNGRIPYSIREVERSLHISDSTACRLLKILQDRGFIVCTKRGAFSLKADKDASEWALTEYASDHPPAHATKDFIRWQPPENVDPPHRRKSRTRLLQRSRTVTLVKPYGYSGEAVEAKKPENGYPSEAVGAQNETSTVTPVKHLQLPGRGCEPGVLLPSPEGEPAEKRPWSTPTVEEVPWDTLPTEVRMLVLGLPDPELGYYGRTARATLDEAYQAATEKQPDAVADVPGQAEKAPPAADVVDEAEKAKREAAAEAPPAQPDQPVSAPDPVPARPMLPGDRQRALRLVRNKEAVARDDAAMKARPVTASGGAPSTMENAR
jgi:hypothetical protein